jgi:hypothetical protein
MKKLIAIIALGLSAGIQAAPPDTWEETGWEEPQESTVKLRDGGPRRGGPAHAHQDALPYLFWVD